MGKPAARMGDPTMHGGTIVIGFPTVLIGGKPAARIGDMHVCPMVTPGTPPIPHIGGPITMGVPTVLIGNMPAACMGDMAICIGPPDTIAMGCPTVLIGMAGGGGAGAAGAAAGAAAPNFAVKTERRGGLFGAIIGGIVGAILGAVAGAAIGGLPGAIVGGIVGAMAGAATGYGLTSKEGNTTTYGNSIVIEGTPQFRQRVVGDLNVIASTPTGGALLNDIDESGKTIIIQETSGDNGEDADSFTDGCLQPNGKSGPGTNSIINYNPHKKKLNGEPWQTRPPEIGLAHELIHSCHDAYGTTNCTESVEYTNLIDGATEFDHGYELQAVGLGTYQGNAYTENKIRNEFNQHLRTHY